MHTSNIILLAVLFTQGVAATTATTTAAATTPGDYCCRLKNVGGIDYTLQRQESTASYGCTDNCVYNTPAGGKVCFKPGNLESFCNYGHDCGNLVTRKNVLDIKEDFEKYNRALNLVKTYTNASSFEDIGQYHGRPLFCNWDQTGPPGSGNDINGCCIPHWDQEKRISLFTPWHRLYTFQMEMSLKIASSSFGSLLAMPYWDWTSKLDTSVTDIPLANQGQWKNGPIKGSNRNPTPMDFTELRSMVKTAYKYSCTFPEFNKQIVQPHNFVHVYIGGDMGTIETASYDPVFFLHHSYVDYQYAFFQELQKIKKKTINYPLSIFKMQPFNRDSNPYQASRINSEGGQTEDYKNNFCYTFDQLLFEGLTPQQFYDQTKEEMKFPSLYAAMLLWDTGITSILEYDLLRNGATLYPNIASLATYGSVDKAPDYFPPTTHDITLYDVTDLLNDPIEEPMDKTQTFNISSYVDAHNENLDKSKTYKPIVVYRAGDSDILVFRYHEDHIHDYPPKIHFRAGSKVEFLTADGTYSTNVIEILPSVGPSRNRTVNGTFYIQKKEHTFLVTSGSTSRELTIGYTLDGRTMCNDTGDAQSVDNELDAISWGRMPEPSQTITLQQNRDAIIAWCEGTPPINVYKFGNEAEYEDCAIPAEDKAPWDDQGPEGGYLLDTTIKGTQYFANGVGTNCLNGWKLTVNIV